MNASIASIRPKKKSKQTSIRDFITVTTKRDINSKQLTENKDSVDKPLAETSDSRPMDCNQSLSNNESTVRPMNDSIELIECSQMSDLSEIPETPERQVSEDEDMESEDDIQELFALNRMPDCLLPMSRLRAHSTHFVLFEVPLSQTMASVPKPFPNFYSDKWDAKHVKMPNSFHNQITAVQTTEGQDVRTRVSKWELIRENLLSGIKSSESLEEVIKTYNPFVNKYNFDVLHTFFNEHISPEERIQFFEEMLPQMIQLTLDLPNIVTQSVPLLRQRQNAILFLSQHQIACLLANAFFCTFPKRSKPNEEFKNYPIINFLGLFTSFGNEDFKCKLEKLKCIVNYFRRVLKDMPKGVVSFERRFLSDEELPNWHNSYRPLRKLVVIKNGLIEKEGKGLLQVDFANKYIGGGVIGSGCVQEEIRFAISPELIISRLFTERLLNNEVIVINGCEQFSEYTGYANTFEWAADYEDKTPYDEWCRRYTSIVAMDALYFSCNESDIQFQSKHFERELNKAFSGFTQRRTCNPSNKCAIASGNWGCGAFNGDPYLKAIIQLMAASQADRDLVLFTFNDYNLKKHFQKFYEFVSKNSFKVKHLYKALKLYQQKRRNYLNIFEFIIQSKDLILQIC